MSSVYVICWIFLQTFQPIFAYRQTVWTQIRLLLKKWTVKSCFLGKKEIYHNLLSPELALRVVKVRLKCLNIFPCSLLEIKKILYSVYRIAKYFCALTLAFFRQNEEKTTFLNIFLSLFTEMKAWHFKLSHSEIIHQSLFSAKYQ